MSSSDAVGRTKCWVSGVSPTVCGYYLRLDGQLSVTIVCVPMHCVLLECICLLDGVVGLCVNYNVFTLCLCRFDIADKTDTLSLATTAKTVLF